MTCRKLFCLTFALLSMTVLAQGQMTVRDFVADADSLYSGIQEIHPDLFAFTPEEPWIRDFQAVKNSFDNSTTVFDFYKTMAPLVARLQDGHTALHFPKVRLEEAGTRLFPLAVQIDKPHKNLFVRPSCVPGANIPDGAQIISINGIPALGIVDSLTKYISGEQEFFRLELLARDFAPLLTLLCPDSVFSVCYDREGTLTTENVTGCTLSELGSDNTTTERGNNGYSLRIDEGTPKVAVLTLDRSDINLEAYGKFLSNGFAQLRTENIDRLVVDIRNNGGGDSCVADELFEYSATGAFIQCDKIIAKISPKIQQRYRFLENHPVGIETTNYASIDLQNYPNRFRGTVYLLTSNYTFSAAADLAWTFKHYKMGKIIGEETGGLGVCFGDTVPLRLPHTQLTCSVSWKKFYNVGATNASSEHGTIPDRIVPAINALQVALKEIRKPHSSTSTFSTND